MNGPQHYAEAERLIEAARGEHGDRYADDHAAATRLAEAQVHATLALAAATAGARMTVPHHDGSTATFLMEDGSRWAEVTA